MTPALPPIVDLLELEEHENPDARCFLVRVSAGAEDELADRLAVRIACLLTSTSDWAFDAWIARVNGGAPHDQATKEELEAYLLADVQETEDPAQNRLLGAVVEHLWAAIAPLLEGAWGRPIHVEHDHFSVIDPGGDGVSLYELGDAELRFRLWESKRHAGRRSLTSVVTSAGKQMKANGAQYLARLAKPLQTHEDERVKRLAGRVVRLWTEKDERSAVGVSVGTSAGGTLPARPLRGLLQIYEYADSARCEGLIIELSDLSSFSERVRNTLMRGIE